MHLAGYRFPVDFSDLPTTLPVFPLEGVLLLPGGILPLNIFEVRYLEMTDASLATHRLVGMIQPKVESISDDRPILYETGCAGRITAFSETQDGRYLITLTGVCRFDIKQEISTKLRYRTVIPDWNPYYKDFSGTEDQNIDRKRLFLALDGYFIKHQIKADWDAIKGMTNLQLINSMAMVCPFGAVEKQALLTADKTADRAATMISLLEMAVHPMGSGDELRH